MRARLAAVGLAVGVLGTGCFSVNYGDVGFDCGPGDFCPEEYECRADNRCHRIGSPDDIDAAGVDGSPDDPDARQVDAADPQFDSGPVPANDDCSGAITLSPDAPLTGQSIANATDDATGQCAAAGGGDVAYQFTLAENQHAQIQVSNADFNPRIVLQSTTCPGSDVACADGFTGTSEALEEFDLPPGTYTVWVDTASGGSAFDIALTLSDAIPEPANDECSTAEVLPENVTRTRTTLGADDDYDLEATCLAADGPDVVHRIELSSNASVLLTVTPTVPAGWPVAVSLRDTATCDVADPDLACLSSSPGARLINKPTLPTGTYDVIVDGASGQAGDYTIRYTTFAPDATFGYRPLKTTGNTYTPLDQGLLLSTAGQDDVVYQVANIGFAFPYFGQTRSQVFVSTNGWLAFNSTTGNAIQQLDNDCPLQDPADPTDGIPDEMIAVFWDDLLVSGTNGSVVRHLTGGVAPNRTFSVEWSAMGMFESHPCESPDSCPCPDQGPGCENLVTSVTHTLVLHENGDIEFRYGPRSAPAIQRECDTQHRGCSATIGLRNAGNTDTDVASCNVNNVDAGDVIYWVHPTN